MPVLWVSPMKDGNNLPETDENTLSRVANIVSAYVRRNTVPARQIGPIIRVVYEALAAIKGTESTGAGSAFQPAIPVRKSVTPEHLICLEDGRHLKMLKRYLRSHYKMTPDQYCVKWGLPVDYPIVAPNYAQQRSDFAKKIGLGRSSSGSGIS